MVHFTGLLFFSQFAIIPLLGRMETFPAPENKAISSILLLLKEDDP